MFASVTCFIALFYNIELSLYTHKSVTLHCHGT